MKGNTVTNTYCFIQIARCLCAASVMVLCAVTANALPDYDLDCRGCHGTTKNGMALTGFQTQTNLGAGLLKVFKVIAGQTAAIQFSVTNRYGGSYGLNLNSLDSSGLNNAADHMSYTPDATWDNQMSGSWFTVGPTVTSPIAWTFNLAVSAGTPADYYPVETQMAGRDSSNAKWSQVESFYIQVVPVAARPTPLLLVPRHTGSTFSVDVATTSGFTYYLEYRTNLTTGIWTAASQASGDGTVKTLTDSSASDSQRVYHVRVQ
jgi:hypothetical protein